MLHHSGYLFAPYGEVGLMIDDSTAGSRSPNHSLPFTSSTVRICGAENVAQPFQRASIIHASQLLHFPGSYRAVTGLRELGPCQQDQGPAEEDCKGVWE